jgi:DNA (cytosine-5)-methyltransferase 1
MSTTNGSKQKGSAQDSSRVGGDDDTIVVVDLFCGAGGFSSGIAKAAAELEKDVVLIGVNHDQPAVETYKSNFDAHAYLEDIGDLGPRKVVSDVTGSYTTTVDLLVAGPECRTHSTARGGANVDSQSREPAFGILSWLANLDVKKAIIENVKGIQNWGLIEEGNASRDGAVFDVWRNAMNGLGYTTDSKVLKASQYGDPTIRERFFLVLNKTGGVSFPDPTHSEDDGALPDPRSAATALNLDDIGTSVWTRDLELSGVTPPASSVFQRIADGIKRHCETDAMRQYAELIEPLSASSVPELRSDRVVDAAEAETALDGNSDDESLFLIDTSAVETAECAQQNMIVRQQSGAFPTDVSSPVPTVATGGGHALATTETKALVMPKNGRYGGINSNSLYQAGKEPAHTITTDPRAKLVTPATVALPQGEVVANSESGDGTADDTSLWLCSPQLFPTVFDIKYRQLRPDELKQVQGFAGDFQLAPDAKYKKNKLIGNAVPVNLAGSLAKHVLTMDDSDLSRFGGGLSVDTIESPLSFEEVRKQLS